VEESADLPLMKAITGIAGLLRARRERPRRRAAQECDKLASPHFIEMHSIPVTVAISERI